MRLDDADVLAFALAEAGRHHGAEEIRKWLSGDRETMPPDLAPVIEGILQNLEYHVTCMNARLLSEPDIADESLRKMASLPPTRLKARAKSRRQKRSGETTYHCQPLSLPVRTHAAIKSMARALGVSMQSIIELWLEEAVDAVLERTREIEPSACTQSQWNRRGRRLPSKQLRATIRRIQK
jgi:hypothetical protein